MMKSTATERTEVLAPIERRLLVAAEKALRASANAATRGEQLKAAAAAREVLHDIEVWRAHG